MHRELLVDGIGLWTGAGEEAPEPERNVLKTRWLGLQLGLLEEGAKWTGWRRHGSWRVLGGPLANGGAPRRLARCRMVAALNQDVAGRVRRASAPRFAAEWGRR